MKRLFTLIVVLSIAISGFAQRSVSLKKSVDMTPEKQMVVTGFEDLQANFPASERTIMANPIETELAQTYYDWQSNMGPRNFTAVWPDGYAVACYTQALSTDMADRGTGLSIYDPATGEWTFTDGRVEPEKTGFGSIARYGENGLVVAAHTSSSIVVYINENFRNGGEWGEPIYFGGANGGAWPSVACSGENNDIIHVIYTIDGIDIGGVLSPALYARIANGAVEVEDVQLELLDGNHATDFGSNIAYFMPWDSSKPNRVSFIINNAWSDCKLVISEDNGATWSERIFWKHPNINGDFTDGWFFYPRWTSAAFDSDDNLHLVYEYNATTGVAGDGSYYPGIGGVAYWSEVLPKNELCVGGIGNVGEPFVMDSSYTYSDIYASNWFWSDATHEILPEHFGVLEIVDGDGNVLPRESAEGYWPIQDSWGSHGLYNCGTQGFASMFYDNGTIYSVWSQICGSSEAGVFFDGVNHYFRLFCNVSYDNGMTWEGTKGVLTDFMNMYDEMVYPVIIPHIYEDADGKFIQLVYQNDQEPGTYVQSDESTPDNCFYRAVRIDVDFMDVEENQIVEKVDMNIFPNPVSGEEVTIQVNSMSTVSIYNAVGQLVETFNFDGQKTINVSEYASGVYFIKADNGSAITTQKVVVK